MDEGEEEENKAAHWTAALFVAQPEIWQIFEHFLKGCSAVMEEPHDPALTRKSMIDSMDLTEEECTHLWDAIRELNRRN
jgi:hypothetical protein